MEGVRRTQYEVRRYLIVGVLNVIFTGCLYAASLYVLRWHHLVALTAAFASGTIFSYILNYLWVFQPESRFAFGRRFIKYLATYVGTFSLNLAGLYVLVDYVGGDPFWSQVVLMGVIVSTNFILTKYWSLRRPSSEG